MVTFEHPQPMNSDGGTMPQITSVEFDFAEDGALRRHAELMREKYWMYDCHAVFYGDATRCFILCLN